MEYFLRDDVTDNETFQFDNVSIPLKLMMSHDWACKRELTCLHINYYSHDAMYELYLVMDINHDQISG